MWLGQALASRPARWQVDSEAVFEAARYHGVLPLLYERLQANPEVWASLPKSLCQGMRRAYYQAIALEMGREPEIQAVLARLQEAGLSVLLLKGTPLAYRLYPAPYLRSRCDTDLLFRGRREAEKAWEVLRLQGYQRPKQLPGHQIFRQFSLYRKLPGGAGITLDLHWRINNHPFLAQALPPAELYRRGLDQREAWNLPAALEHLSAALAQSPDALTYAQRAEAYRLTGQYDQAAADLERALALDPQQPEAWRQMALLSQAQGAWEQALTAVNTLIALRPDDGTAYALRAQIYAQGLGAPRLALADYEQAAALSHTLDSATLTERWHLYASLNEWNQAFLTSLKMFITGSQDPARYYYRAWSLIQLNRLDEAIQQLFTGIRQYPDYPVAFYYALGVAYSERGAWAEAITSLEVALAQTGAAPEPNATWQQLGISVADILGHLGIAYLRVGQCETGGAVLQRAVDESSDPNRWGWAVRGVGACYTALTPTPTPTPAPSPTPHAVQVPPTSTP